MHLVAPGQSILDWVLGCLRLAWPLQGLKGTNVPAHCKPAQSTLVGKFWSIQLRQYYLKTTLKHSLSYVWGHRFNRINLQSILPLISRDWVGWNMGHGNLESKRGPSFEANVFVSLDWHGNVLEKDRSLLTFNLLVMIQHDIFSYFFHCISRLVRIFSLYPRMGKNKIRLTFYSVLQLS